MKALAIVGAVTLSLLAASPCAAQANQPEYYARLAPDLRVGLQRALLWTGHFVGVSDGIFGGTSLDAVRRYQASIGAPQTGFLTKPQAVALIEQALKIQDSFGYKLFNDPYTGSTIGLPGKFVQYNGQTKRGSQFISPVGAVDMVTMRIPAAERSLDDLYRLHMTRTGRQITYKAFRGDWFVVAGRENGKRFYVRAHSYQDDVRGFAISYPEHLADVFDRLTVAMSSDFKPDSAGLSVAQARMNTVDIERGFSGETRVVVQPQVPAPQPDSPQPPQVATAPSIVPSIPVPRDERPASPQPAQPEPQAQSAPPATGGPAQKLEGKVSTGTGFAVSAEGHFLTNAHVVDGCSAVSVGSYGSARIIERDTQNDIALLKIDATIATKPLTIAEGSPKLGEEVIALGFPLQDVLQNGLNATRGDVSSLAGIGGDSRMIQITAAVQPGNSGGPLINGKGEVVGIVTSKLNAAKIASATGDIPQSVNFAIRPEIAEIFMRRFGVTPRRLGADAPKAQERHQVISAVQDAVNVVICRK